MAKEEFDFKALQELNIPKYLKEYCKPAMMKKAKAAICLIDLKMNKASKKTSFIIIPCKKMPEAITLFKKIKAEKLHLLKKVVLVEFGYDGQANKATVSPKKGGLTTELLEVRGKEFFEANFQWGFEVIGVEGNESKEELVANKENLAPEEDIKAVDKIINSLAGAIKTEAKEVAANLKQKSVLATDQEKVDAISTQFDELKAAFDSSSEEVKQKVKAKYDKVLGYAPQIAKIKAAVEKALAQSGEEGQEDTSELNKELEQLLKRVRRDVKAFDKKFQKATSSLQEAASSIAAKGEELVNKFF
jgi:ElaB/YqjD/DUF883 family membrane-anchored ribosome-binding protein